MSDYPNPSDEQLHAFIDGAMKVAAAIQRDPALAARVAAFNADKRLLREAYGPLVEEPIPAAWTAMIADAPLHKDNVVAFKRPTLTRALMALAASVVLMIGGWAVYSDMIAGNAEALVTEALAVHAGTKPSATVVADSGTALKTLKVPLKTPDLTKMGYMLAKVEVYGDKSGVKLGYRDKDNKLFTLYLKPSPGTPRFDMLKRGDARICIWQDDVLATIMVGEMSAGEMLRLASLAYAGLT